MHALGVLAALIIGLITAIVSHRVLRNATGLDSPLLGMSMGALAALGLLSDKGSPASSLLTPFGALGIAIPVVLCLKSLLRREKMGKPKTSRRLIMEDQDGGSDPWELEIRKGGQMADQFRKRKR